MIVQRGYNSAYPETIETWTLKEKNIPEWLSDYAKIGFIDGEGNITLGSIDTNSGGLDILKADGEGVLVRLEKRDSYVCYSKGHNIFSLTPKQFDLLYEVVSDKK